MGADWLKCVMRNRKFVTHYALRITVLIKSERPKNKSSGVGKPGAFSKKEEENELNLVPIRVIESFTV